ncbi:PREDICTED: glutathione-specific gamma-glutamylcyclotransferase 1-like [Priapulus caudatus]|uniref:glutathione-specific gamma-glutamylcyclotransferase n=1 Tax=Priapulus caudatus TaxID=37621 RepID=A0ABM1EJM4_PRICU|nr:PREDICTED: glutathione-specific gamma-glutamylcyclotransferase 1-like [Priapulus caudatus]
MKCSSGLPVRFWVFGYGSLIWKPGFSYTSKTVGYVKGFSLKFWQGNCTHRGTPEKPGRVATLITDKNALAWGVAYEVVGPEQTEEAYEHLNMRECNLGGYQTCITDFHAHAGDDSTALVSTLPVVVYIATEENPHYVGASSIDTMALDIASAEGQCGHNVEYLMKLTRFFHEEDLLDDELFALERAVMRILDERGVPLSSLMNHSCCPLNDVPELETSAHDRENFSAFWWEKIRSAPSWRAALEDVEKDRGSNDIESLTICGTIKEATSKTVKVVV